MILVILIPTQVLLSLHSPGTILVTAPVKGYFIIMSNVCLLTLVTGVDLFAPVALCGHSRVQSKCSKGCVCECDRIVVTVSLDNSRLGWLMLCQE